MRTIETVVYSYDELSEEAKEKAIEAMSDINTHDRLYEHVYEKWIEKLEEMGFSKPKIYFSGFYSQGDGASFECEYVDAQKILGNKPFSGQIQCNFVRGVDRPYLNATYSTFWEERDLSTELDDLCDELLEIYRDVCYEIYDSLRKEYEYLIGREAIEDTIRANNYEFTIDGKPV
jgi:hypothetical protein